MRRVLPIAVLLLVCTNALMLARLVFGDTDRAAMLPRVRYWIDLQLDVDLGGEDAVVRMYLPAETPTQGVEKEWIESSGLSYGLEQEGGNRRGIFRAEAGEGHRSAVYHAIVDLRPRRLVLDEGLVAAPPPPELAPSLEATELIQADDEAVRAKAAELRAGLADGDVATLLRRSYDFVHGQIANSDYENALDAATTLKWGEAFCGGKSRLLCALLRANGVPARMVGGLILEPGSKRVTHAWCEAWVNGQWLPMDAVNGHYLAQPGHYLVLYHGDEILVSRTKDIHFQYLYKIKKWRAPPEDVAAGTASPWNAYLLWDAFRKAHISLNLLRILLLLPVAVLVVIFARNVVGLPTFGTFMPALLAVAFRDTGLLWGLALLGLVLVVGLAARSVLDRLQLLHLPRLGVLLAVVVLCMLAVSFVSVRAGVLEPAHIAMYPIVILVGTVENCFFLLQERGAGKALRALGGTALVVIAIFLLIDSAFVQNLVFAFPELLLAVVGGYLLLGRWVGLRASELLRFRALAVSTPAAAAAAGAVLATAATADPATETAEATP